MSNEVTPGRYRHFKGNEYTVLYIAKSTEDESEVVVYRAEYGTNQIWVRPLQQFTDRLLIDGKWIRRFERIES